LSIRTRRNSKRLIAGVLAGAFALSGVAVSSTVGADDVSVNSPTPASVRLSGADRYATAVEVAKETLGFSGPLVNFDNLQNIVIATGENWPDGLAASGLVGALQYDSESPNGTILLLTRTNSLPTVVADFLALAVRDGAFKATPSNLYVVGGTAAVSDAVVDELIDILGWDASDIAAGFARLDGVDRYDTAASIALEVDALVGGTDCVVVPTGANFPDALAAGSLGVNGTYFPGDDWSYPCAILLTRQGVFPPAAADALEEIDPAGVVITGGVAAVSQGVEDEIGELVDAEIIRLGGANRYDTATLIANFLNSYDFGATTLASELDPGEFLGLEFPVTVPGFYNMPSNAILVRGNDFADALTAATLTTGFAGGCFFVTGDLGAETVNNCPSPILLTEPTSLRAETNVWIENNRNQLSTITAVGGTAAVGASTLASAVAASNQVAPSVALTIGQALDVVQPYAPLVDGLVTLSAKAGADLEFPAGNTWNLAIVKRQLTPTVQAPTFTRNNTTKTITLGVPSAAFGTSDTVTVQEFRQAFQALPQAVALFDLEIDPSVSLFTLDDVDLDANSYEMVPGFVLGLTLSVINTQCSGIGAPFGSQWPVGAAFPAGTPNGNLTYLPGGAFTLGLCGDNTQQAYTLWDNLELQGAVFELLTAATGKTPSGAELIAFAKTLPASAVMVGIGNLFTPPTNTPPSGALTFPAYYAQIEIAPGALVSTGSQQLVNLARIRSNITWT